MDPTASSIIYGLHEIALEHLDSRFKCKITPRDGGPDMVREMSLFCTSERKHPGVTGSVRWFTFTVFIEDGMIAVSDTDSAGSRRFTDIEMDSPDSIDRFIEFLGEFRDRVVNASNFR